MGKFKIGQEVVRSKGDYVVGRIGSVIDIDSEGNRARVAWEGDSRTWVSFGSLELTSIPYEIVRGASRYPKYRRI